MKQRAIIVDIDGTFSNCEHRRHFLEGENPDWKSFNESCVTDTVNKWCRILIDEMNSCCHIIFVSGRMEEYRKITENFICMNIGWMDVSGMLFMRKDGDFRSDTIIKEEIHNEHIKDKYDILFCIDDRPSVCRMWRSLGLTVLQCDDKEF